MLNCSRSRMTNNNINKLKDLFYNYSLSNDRKVGDKMAKKSNNSKCETRKSSKSRKTNTSRKNSSHNSTSNTSDK